MPKKQTCSGTKSDLLPHKPKPNSYKKTRRPTGLFVRDGAISKSTSRAVWNYFNTPDFPWEQRFKRFSTCHYNNKKFGPYVGDEQQADFERDYPAMHAMVHEATFWMNEHIAQFEPDSSFKRFKPESVNVHKHEPGWGLGAHYDDSHDEGMGIVLMITVCDPDAYNPIPREFRFTDPVGGYQYSVRTPDGNCVVFKDACYDFWRHESIRNKKQTGTALSFTVRLKSVDGYLNFKNDKKYGRGAPAAEMTAHMRMREQGMDCAPGVDMC